MAGKVQPWFRLEKIVESVAEEGASTGGMLPSSWKTASMRKSRYTGQPVRRSRGKRGMRILSSLFLIAAPALEAIIIGCILRTLLLRYARVLVNNDVFANYTFCGHPLAHRMCS